jgi:hypothetical protein
MINPLRVINQGPLRTINQGLIKSVYNAGW